MNSTYSLNLKLFGIWKLLTVLQYKLIQSRLRNRSKTTLDRFLGATSPVHGVIAETYRKLHNFLVKRLTRKKTDLRTFSFLLFQN